MDSQCAADSGDDGMNAKSNEMRADLEKDNPGGKRGHQLDGIAFVSDVAAFAIAGRASDNLDILLKEKNADGLTEAISDAIAEGISGLFD